MEIYELRYFLEVARFENIHRAAESLRVSPGSLSKAVARIEGELGTKLFSRDGRNIRITGQGELLRLRATRIIRLEESARIEIAGHHGRIRVVFAGPEVLLSKMGLQLASTLQERHPGATFEYLSCDDETALEKAANGEAHLALVTGDVPPALTAKTLLESRFLTVVGQGHPLHGAAKRKREVHVEEVLAHPFASPSHPILGRVGSRQSLDGWRDDRFTRKVAYHTTSLKLLESLVTTGRALAYLPDYYAAQLDVLPLKVTGCPYSCVQKIKMAARRPKEIGWLNQLF